MGELNKGLYEFFSTVQAQPVDWLWYPYIPCGKLTLLQGDPGEGKSTFMLNVAALLTQGRDMPDGYKVHVHVPDEVRARGNALRYAES